MKHEIAVIAYDTDMSILFVVFNQFDTICFHVFFSIDIIKKLVCYDDSLLRFMHTSYEILENCQRHA